ncbi:MAG: fluoride efflux transporter CrcB [Dehalococcoidales bacterium]|nr:fluoride efflux transporter CrcB [Dehalococcoidales bacterium]
MQQLLFLALAGALGTLSRYALSGLIQKITGIAFPWGTLIINATGGLIIGYIMQLALNTDIIPANLRVIVTIGFLGAFTTFSTFSYETVKLLEDGAFVLGALNVILNVVIGLGATFIGMLLGKITIGGAG